MPPTTTNAAGPRPVARERPRPPPPAVVAAEAQWLFTEEELLQTPSIVDGMKPEDEKLLRRKGVNFIQQAGIMLKLPQTTMGTATVFFNRFLMRASLKAKDGHKPLHHYQIAAVSLFLATKVEENCRKMKELVTACVRVALKDPNKEVDDQMRDFWKWRDTLLLNEDILLETICFDLSVESPFRIMYSMLQYHQLEHNKTLRNSAWAFLTDSALTQICLLFDSRTIAAAALFAGMRLNNIDIPDEDGKAWWEVQHVKLGNIRRAINAMADMYGTDSAKEGMENPYVCLKTPVDSDSEETRLRDTQLLEDLESTTIGMERSTSSQSLKRKREDGPGTSRKASVSTNGDDAPKSPEELSAKRRKSAEKEDQGGSPDGSEEGEVDE